jgi:hypothetical protein
MLFRSNTPVSVVAAFALGLVSTHASAGALTVNVVVASKKPNGKAWDAFGGLPDIAMCVMTAKGKVCVPGGDHIEPGVPAHCQDSLMCTFTLNVPTNGNSLMIELVDVDMAENDAIGSGTCNVGATCRLGAATVTVSR